MADDKVYKDPITGVKTTGHVWDDNLMEFNNPLPTWWLWAFYATFVFGIVYWIIYPSFPTGFTEKGFFTGVGNTITFKDDEGKDVTTHWNMRALYLHEMQNDEVALKQQKHLSEVAASSYEDIAKDQNKTAFVKSYGDGIFGDYCAACHQVGGGGVIGAFPNLIDDAWLWGGETEQIEHSIRYGRNGYMPGFEKALSDEKLDQVANYVLSLSGEKHDDAAAVKGQKIFSGEEGGCYYCHTSEGTGMVSQGSANLTDKIWTVADVPGSTDKLEAVKSVIAKGIYRQMPAWESRLGDDEIKVLTAYLRQLAQ